MTVNDEIRRYIVDTLLNGDDRDFENTTDLQESGILDSFATTELVSFLESRFGVTLAATEVSAENFKNVNNIARLIEAVR